jgi:hypothetical protein
MSTINNQTKGLFAIDSVEDLSHDSAAAIQGGILVWSGPNFTGVRRDLQASSNLLRERFDNDISSIHNNTQKTWVFYTNPNFTGAVFRLDPGMRLSGLGIRDNQISSMRSV